MANIAELQVSLNLDTSKFKSDVATATNDVANLKNALTGLKSRTFNINLNTNLKSQLAGFKSARAEIKNLQKHLKGLQDSIKATTGNKVLNLQVNSNAEKVHTDLKNINANSQLLKANLTGARSGVISYNNSLQLMHSSIKGVSASIRSLCTDVRKLNILLTKTNVQLKQMGTKTIKIKADSNIPKITGEATQSLYKLTGTFTNVEGSMKRTFTGVGQSISEAERNMKSMVKGTENLRQVGSKLQATFKDANGKIVKTMNEANSAVKKTTQSAKKLGSALANVKNVAQGIIIAQSFYTAVNAVQDMVGSMWEMHKSVETNTMAFEQLTGSAERAKDMIEYLQKYSASTVFTFEQASQSAKTLLAYGFKLENLSYVMKTIGDATSAMGKPENFERIGLAMGQMLAKGTAKAEELRQLMEANVPVVEILTEKLGLTAAQVVNIGDEAISSTKVVNALLQGLEERYGGMSTSMATTTTGLLNNIRESIAYIGSQLFKPLYDSLSGILKPIAEKLNELSTVIRNAGIDGALKYLFPPDMYNSIKVFIGLLSQLGQSIFALIKAISPVGRELMYTFINVFNVASPIIIVFLNTLAKIIGVLTSCRPALQAFITTLLGFIVVRTVTGMIRDFSIGLGVLSKLATFATKAVSLLKGAMLLLVKNPVVAAIALISAAIIGLIMSTERGRAAVDKLWVSLARLMGIKNVEVFKPLEPGDLEDDLDNFFDKLDKNITGVENGTEDVEDALGGASKEAKKFAASFDELFQVPEELDETGNALGGLTDGLFDGLDTGGLDEIGKDLIDTGAFDIEPIEIPVTIIPPPPIQMPPSPGPVIIPVLLTGLEAIKSAITSLVNALSAIPKSISIGVSLLMSDIMSRLASLRDLIGTIPTTIGIGVSLVASGVIDTITSIATGINTLLLPGFQLIPSTIANLVLPGFELLNNSVKTNLIPGFSQVFQSIKDFLLPGIELIPMVITSVAIPGFDLLVSSIKDTLLPGFALIPQQVGSIMASIPSLIQSGVGVAGAAAGSVCAAILKPFAELSALVLSNLAQGFARVFSWLAKLPSQVGSLVSPVKEQISSKFGEAWSGVTETCSNFMDWMEGKWGYLAGALALVVAGIAITLTGGWAAIGTGIMAIVGPVISWIGGIWSTLMGTTLPGLLTKGAAICGTIFSVFTGGMSTAFADSKDSVEGDANTMSSNVKSKFEELKSSVGNTWNNLKSDTNQKWSDMKNSISNMMENAMSTVSSKANSMKSTLSSTWSSVSSNASSMWNTMYSTISNKLSQMVNSARNIVQPFITVFNNIRTGVVNAVTSMFNTISSIFSRITSLISNVISSVSNAVSRVSSAVSRVSSAVSGIFGRSITIDAPDLTPQPTSIPTPRSPIADMNVPQLYSGGLMSRDTVISNARTSTTNAMKELGTIQHSVNSLSTTPSQINNQGSTTGYTNMSNEINDKPILYVGTLIADDRSLKELERKMEVIRTKERNRRV